MSFNFPEVLSKTVDFLEYSLFLAKCVAFGEGGEIKVFIGGF